MIKETANFPEKKETKEYGNNVTIRVSLVRHGQKEYSTATSDTPLTDNGREQARELGRSKKESDFIKSYYSPTERTEETARLAAKSSPHENKGVSRPRNELEMAYEKGGTFDKKIVEFKVNELGPDPENLTAEEHNRRIMIATNKHTDYFLNLGPKKPDPNTNSPVEIASKISGLLLHYVEMSKRLYSNSTIDLINATHDLNIASFVKEILYGDRGEKFHIDDIGGPIGYTEECEIIIHRENSEKVGLKLLFRGKEYNIDAEPLEKLAAAEYEQ